MLYDPQKEHYLSLGLSYLHRLVLTSEFDDRCHLLKAFKGGPDCSISDILSAGSRVYTFETDYSKGEQHANVFAQRTIDGDAGPEEAWRWANPENPTIGTYRHKVNEQRTLRQWGYVMWDFARLTRWDIFNHDWQNLSRNAPISDSEAERRKDEMCNSWAARHEIWVRGGRGWWSAGDESRVIWPPGGPIEIP